jgi:hypothetical protein
MFLRPFDEIWRSALPSGFASAGMDVSCAVYRARICKRLWSPGIKSDESVPPAYVAWWTGATNRVVVLARRSGNRFLGSLKGLQNTNTGSVIL